MALPGKSMNRANIAAGKIKRLWIFLMGRQRLGEKAQSQGFDLSPLFLFTFRHYTKTEFLSISFCFQKCQEAKRVDKYDMVTGTHV